MSPHDAVFQNCLRGILAGLFLNLALWSFFAALKVVLFSGKEPHRYFACASAFWAFVWMIGGLLAGRFADQGKAAAAIYGVGIGTLTGALFLLYPYCSYAYDPTIQQSVILMGMPALVFDHFAWRPYGPPRTDLRMLVSFGLFWGLFGWGVGALALREKKPALLSR